MATAKEKVSALPTTKTDDSAATDTPAPTKLKFKRTKRVTLPIVKLTADVPRYLKFTDKIYLGKEIKEKLKEGEKKKAPAHLVNVIDLESGEEGVIVLNKVLMSTLLEEYPDDSYIGKSFEITKLAKNPGKDYHPFSIIEGESED